MFVSPTLEFSPIKINLTQPGEFSDDQKWAARYFRSVRLADVNGDGKADMIGRNAEGVHVALSTGLGFANEELYGAASFRIIKAGAQRNTVPPPVGRCKWRSESRSHHQKRDGIRVALSTGSGFEQSTLWSTYFSDDAKQPWKKVDGYSGTICAADVNGDGLADIVARGPGGMYVSLSSSTSFTPPAIWTADFSDHGTIAWKEAKYSSTIQLADVNGDGMADLIARGPKGYWLAYRTVMDSEKRRYGLLHFPMQADGVMNASYFESIRHRRREWRWHGRCYCEGQGWNACITVQWPCLSRRYELGHSDLHRSLSRQYAAMWLISTGTAVVILFCIQMKE